MENILDIYCPLHGQRIEFLNLNKGINKGQRALCKKCKLFDPTEISEALEIWKKYMQSDKKCFEKEIDQILDPLINLEKRFREITKILLNSFNRTLEIFVQKIEYTKQQSLIEIKKIGNADSLSKLQNIAEILAEQRQIYNAEDLKLNQLYLSKFHSICDQFFSVAHNLKICAELFDNQNYALCTLITDKYKKNITINKQSTFKDFKEMVQKVDNNWTGNLILNINNGKLLTLNDQETIGQLMQNNNPDICLLNDERLRFMKDLFEVGQTDIRKLEYSLDLQTDNFLRKQFNIIKTEQQNQNIPLHLNAAINILTAGDFQKQLNQDLKEQNYKQHLIFLKTFHDALIYCSYYSGKAYRGISNFQSKNLYKTGTFVQWNEVITLTKEYCQAEIFAKNHGIIFEIDVVGSRDISKFSQYPLLILFPYSTFLVQEVIEIKNQSTYIKLREIPYPKSTKIILWVDNQTQINHKYAQEIELKIPDQSFLFCNSVGQAIDLLNLYYWMLFLDESHFRIVLNLKNQNIPFSAVKKLLDYVFKNKNYKNQVFIYCDKITDEIIKQNYQIKLIISEEQLVNSLIMG